MTNDQRLIINGNGQKLKVKGQKLKVKGYKL